MHLDIRSLYLMEVLVALELAVITVFFGLKDARHRAIRDWGWSTLFIVIGLVLVLTQGRATRLVSQVLADTMLIAGATLARRSIRVFRAEPTRDLAGWSIVVMLSCTLALGDAGIANPSARSALVSAVLTVCMWRIAWAIGRRPLPVALAAQRFTTVTYLLSGVVFLFRSVDTLFRSAEGYSLMAESLVDAAMIGSVTMLWVGATLGVMWMALGRQQAELIRLATRDPLTEALNRSAMAQVFARESYRASRTGRTFALAMVDIDHFKRFNDTYGHVTGDNVLRFLVTTMRAIVRQGDLVGRYGGEEFLVLMPDTDLDAGAHVAARVRRGVEAAGYQVKGERVPLTVSVGVAAYPEHGADWDALMAAADSALYRAKTDGRNQVSVAQPATVAAGSTQPDAAQRLCD